MLSYLLPIIASGTLFATAVSANEKEPDLSLEPCINGSVSAAGTHLSQSHEDAAGYFADGVVYSDDPNYVFMIEGQIVAPAHLVGR